MKKYFRLLPFLIVLAVMSFAVRVNYIYDKGQRWVSIEQKSARASESKKEDSHGKDKDKDAAHGEAATATAPEHKGEDGAKAAVEQDARDAAAAESGGTATPEKDVVEELDEGGDIGGFTDSELDILQSLSERREKLNAYEKELERRAALIKAAEDRVNSKVTELRRIQDDVVSAKGEIEKLVAEFKQQEDTQQRTVITTYEKMKPADAARIFNQMDMDVLLPIIRGMKDSKVAPILAQMDVAKAKTVTTLLAEPRTLPAVIENSTPAAVATPPADTSAAGH